MELGQASYVITGYTEKLQEALNQARTAMQEADVQMENIANSISSETENMSNSAGSSFSNLGSTIASVNPAAGMAVSGINSVGAALKSLQAAALPLTAAIAAIGAAVSALTLYFRKSAEGQEKWAKITAYLGQLANIVRDAFIDLGAWIVKAFEDPKAAVQELWEAIKNNLVNRFNALIQMFTSGWEIISNGARGAALAVAGIFNKERQAEAQEYFRLAAEGMQAYGNALVMVITGVDNTTEKVRQLGREAISQAREAAALAEREYALRNRVMRESIQIARLESETARLRLIANDDAEELLDRLNAQGEAIDLIKSKYDIQIAQARERLAIATAQNNLSTNTIEDNERVVALEVDLINLTTQRDTELRRVVSRYSSIAREIEAVEEAERKAIEAIAEARRKAYEDEMADRAAIQNAIYESTLDDTSLMVKRMDEMLAMYDWTLEERYNITKYWLDKIADAEQQNIDNTQIGYNQVTAVIGRSIAEMASEMGNAFAGAEVDFGSLIVTMLAGLRQIVIARLAESIAGMTATEVGSKGILGLATAAAGITGIMGLFAKAPKFSQGGVVPPGYSGDTYPALLSSGETVVPAPQKLTMTQAPGGEVVFIQRGKDLYGVLENYKNFLNATT